MPKAGGTTFNDVLKRQYNKDSIYEIDGYDQDASFDKLINLPDSEKEKINCVIGHQRYGAHSHMTKKFEYITILRDPVQRVLSDYYYMKLMSKGDISNYINSKHFTFEEYLNSNILPNISNFQCRLISGVKEPLMGMNLKPVPESCLEKAKRNLNNFLYVGLIENFDENLIILRELLGWENIYYEKKRVNTLKPKEYEEKIIQMIREKNKLDIELYEYAKKTFEKSKLNYGKTLRSDLNKFQKVNKFLQLYYKARSLSKLPLKLKKRIRFSLKKFNNQKGCG